MPVTYCPHFSGCQFTILFHLRFSKLKERANTQSCHLQDSLEYHEFIESVEEHKVWMKTKEKAIAFDDMWTNLAGIIVFQWTVSFPLPYFQ